MFFLSNPQVNPVQSSGFSWLILAVFVFIMWAVQAYVMKFSNITMQSESIYFYMTLTSLLLAPVAIIMTDFSVPINWGFTGPWVAAMVQILNAIGALTLVYALRYGKAIVGVPRNRTCSCVNNYNFSNCIWCGTWWNVVNRIDYSSSSNNTLVRIERNLNINNLNT